MRCLAVRFGRGPSKLLRGPRNVFPSLLRIDGVISGTDDGKTNDGWLSQTVGEPRPNSTARLEIEMMRLKKG